MIFSLFDRKPDRKRKDARGGQTLSGSADPARGAPDSGIWARGHTLTGTKSDAREQARRTVAKIDEIESEMMAQHAAALPSGTAAGAVFVPGARSAPAAAPASQARPQAEPPLPSPLPGASAASVAERAAQSSEPETLPEHLEEATVLYANGQTAAAAAVLLHAAREPGGGPYLRQTWAMLFDLYQATGNLDEFEALAIGFSTRFERSPPTWDPSLAPPVHAAQDPAGAPLQVVLPAALTAEAFEVLERVERHVAKQGQSAVLDASQVAGVDAVGAARLVRVLDTLAISPGAWYLPGADRLLEIARAKLQVGRPDTNDGAWRLGLRLLQVLDRPQEFDDLAIDYCVTYEVSPPAWEALRVPIHGVAPPAAMAPAVVPPGESAFEFRPQACMLRGNIDGQVPALWAELRAYAQDRAEIVLDCRALRRLDFVAAGELLNEIVALRAGGKYCVLKDVSYLIGGLLVVMGITGLAEVRLRRD